MSWQDFKLSIRLATHEADLTRAVAELRNGLSDAIGRALIQQRGGSHDRTGEPRLDTIDRPARTRKAERDRGLGGCSNGVFAQQHRVRSDSHRRAHLARHPERDAAVLPGYRGTLAYTQADAVPAESLAWLQGVLAYPGLVRALARHGVEALDLPVPLVMLTPAPSCSPDASVSDVLRQMTENRVRHVLVVRSGAMAGIVSIGDLVKIRLDDAELENRVLREMALARLAG